MSNGISVVSLYKQKSWLKCVVNLKVRRVEVVAHLELWSFKSVSLKQEGLTEDL